jgi:serine/threonine protein kinase
MALTTGKKLGPYEIQNPIGAGGMGEVYRAHDSRLNRTVAIKILPAAFSAERERLTRFAQEARAAAALNHPNILSIYDIGEDDVSPYIVSELLEGETLRERLRTGPLPMRKAIDYALQIARGLAAAHEKGIVHRDLKPENLFLTEDGRVAWGRCRDGDDTGSHRRGDRDGHGWVHVSGAGARQAGGCAV